MVAGNHGTPIRSCALKRITAAGKLYERALREEREELWPCFDTLTTTSTSTSITTTTVLCNQKLT